VKLCSSGIPTGNTHNLNKKKYQNTKGKMKLFCAVVGVKNIAFPVEIDASKLVSDLKDAIRVKQKYEFVVCELRLYLTKRRAKWLKEDDLEGFSVLCGSFMRMKASLRIDDSDFKFPDEDKRNRGEIHILIEIPEC